MPAPVVSLEAVGFAYAPGNRVFTGCTARIERGTVTAILGPNGCGKTTLLKLLLGELQPTTGAVRVTEPIAFVPQLFTVGFDYSVLDMVLMGRARQVGLFRQPGRADEAAAVRALERFGIAGLAGAPFHQLSGGQRQLAILARALVSEAALLVLDEPTSALDLGNQASVLGWLRRLAREDGLTVVLTTHQANHALAVADGCLLMRRGQPALHGAADEVLTEEHLQALYGVPSASVGACICSPASSWRRASWTASAMRPCVRPSKK